MGILPQFKVDEDVQFHSYSVQLDIVHEQKCLQLRGSMKQLLIVHEER